MKTRVILFLAISAIATLSFTAISANVNKPTKNNQNAINNTVSEPVGGFLSEDKL